MPSNKFKLQERLQPWRHLSSNQSMANAMWCSWDYTDPRKRLVWTTTLDWLENDLTDIFTWAMSQNQFVVITGELDLKLADEREGKILRGLKNIHDL